MLVELDAERDQLQQRRHQHQLRELAVVLVEVADRQQAAQVA